MTRATFRAFKCRQGVHRLKFGRCKDCRNDDQALAFITTDVTLKAFRAGYFDQQTGLSLRFIKAWDIQGDHYLKPEYTGRINADGTFTPKTVTPLTPALDS